MCVIQPLGAADYLEICKNFDIILLRDIPQMSLENRTMTRRFITLIDTLYDQKVTALILLFLLDFTSNVYHLIFLVLSRSYVDTSCF